MNEKDVSPKAKEALRHIRNAVMHFGKVPSVRQLMTSLEYKSPRSAMLLMEELEEGGFLKKKEDGSFQFVRDLADGIIARTVAVPLVGSVSCGAPMFAEENIEAMIPVSVNLAKQGNKYFLLRADGDSMNKAGIKNGDIVLVRQQSVADDGEKVVALIDDNATIKEFYQKNEVVMLKPNSTEPEYQPIILTDDFQIQGVVVATLPNAK